MTRLYHPDALFPKQDLILQEAQTHYLRHVLRATIGHRFTVFNERDGEWSVVLTALSKTRATITVQTLMRKATLPPDVSLLFAPLKHDPLTFLIEKATELGVHHFYPVMTERCNVSRVNQDRLKSTMIEAAQQCERFDIPTLAAPLSLNKVLAAWNPEVPLFVCQERGDVPSIGLSFQVLSSQVPIGIFIGPEGGFSPAEIRFLKTYSFTRFVHLGPRILRAETAALSALTCYQALVGDWVSPVPVLLADSSPV